MFGFVPVPCTKPFPLCLPGFYKCVNCDWLLGLKEVGAGTREPGLWQHRHQQSPRDSLHLPGTDCASGRRG